MIFFLTKNQKQRLFELEGIIVDCTTVSVSENHRFRFSFQIARDPQDIPSQRNVPFETAPSSWW